VTGFLLPAKLLRDAGVEVRPVWLGSHDAALEALRAGRVMAAAHYKGSVVGQPAFRVLAHTPPIANEPVFVQPDLAAEARDALRRGLVEVARGGPWLLEGVAGATGFRAAAAATYAEARAMVRAAGQAVEDLVPEGWVRANERRRPLWSYAP
jgi:ABC-type phosphate/phosphonate transport system substrate-binding protein